MMPGRQDPFGEVFRCIGARVSGAIQGCTGYRRCTLVAELGGRAEITPAIPAFSRKGRRALLAELRLLAVGMPQEAQFKARFPLRSPPRGSSRSSQRSS